jgi:hypothetical protein
MDLHTLMMFLSAAPFLNGAAVLQKKKKYF